MGREGLVVPPGGEGPGHRGTPSPLLSPGQPWRTREIHLRVGDPAMVSRLMVLTGNDKVMLLALLRLVGGGGAKIKRVRFTGVGAASPSRPRTGRGGWGWGVSDGAVKLEKFLTLAGGKEQAARLERLINLAVRKEADRVADLLNLPECRTVSIFERLADAVPLFKQTPVGTPPMPRNLTPPPSMTGAQSYSGANMPHFLDEHTYEYYNFANTGSSQSFWPAGTTAQDVAHILEETINELRRTSTVVHPQTLPGGEPISVPLTSRSITVRFGVRGSAPYTIGQFFPRSGSGIENFNRDQLQAMAKIVVP